MGEEGNIREDDEFRPCSEGTHAVEHGSKVNLTSVLPNPQRSIATQRIPLRERSGATSENDSVLPENP